MSTIRERKKKKKETRLRINPRLRVCLFQNQIKTMSTPCLSRPCHVCSRPCLSRPCHVCQDYFKFVRTMSCLSRICNFFQDHVMFVMTVFLKSTCFVNNFPSFRTKISQTWKSKTTTTTTTKVCIGLRCMGSQSKKAPNFFHAEKLKYVVMAYYMFLLLRPCTKPRGQKK